MIDGLIIGECLEIHKSQLHLMDPISKLGNVKLFIVEHNVQSSIPDFPFLLLFQNDFNSPVWLQWYQHPFCLGILVRQKDHEDFPELTQFKHKKIYFDFEISDLNSIQNKINRCEQNSLPFCFHMKEKKSSRSIHQILKLFPKMVRPRILDLPSSEFNEFAELENFQEPLFQQNLNNETKYSVIVPHFNSPFFVTNVLRHLNFCRHNYDKFEVLLVDDHSPIEQIHYIRSFVRQHLPQLSIRIFRWPKMHFHNNGSRVFRAGASRNWGAQFANGKFLFFLDSDMLVPPNFFTLLECSFEKWDVIQFKRLHIPKHLSSEASRYLDLVDSDNLYVEESQYWNQFFEAEQWDLLQDHWKYCCTYGLGLKKSLFKKVGRFRRNFIQYGFEDTDLGYRLNHNGARMSMIKSPLLHLTAKPDDSHSFLYQLKKVRQLQPMARNFYILNRDPQLYPRFRTLVD